MYVYRSRTRHKDISEDIIVLTRLNLNKDLFRNERKKNNSKKKGRNRLIVFQQIIRDNKIEEKDLRK